MSTKLELNLATLPADISASIAAILHAGGFAIVRESDTQYPLDGARLDALMRELGRNVAQVVVCADVSDVDAQEAA